MRAAHTWHTNLRINTQHLAHRISLAMSRPENDGNFISCMGSDLPLRMPITKYADLSEIPAQLLDRVVDLEPSALETYAAPLVLAGRDLAIIGSAPHGSDQVAPMMFGLIGKLMLDSSGFSEGNNPPADAATCKPRALVLTPTRSLAKHAFETARTLSSRTDLRCARACGGVPIDASIAECSAAVDLVVATPGRLHDLLDRGAASLHHVRVLMLVGADAMFDSGYDSHLRRVIMDVGLPAPLERQTLLTCTSITSALQRVMPFLFKSGVLGHVALTAATPWLAKAVAPLTKQGVRFADERSKQTALASLLRAGKDAIALEAAAPPSNGPLLAPGSVPCLSLVIVASRRHCEMVEYFLKAEGFGVVALATDKPKRSEKQTLLSKLSSGWACVLVATDAALGVISEELGPIGHVVAFDFPTGMAEYVQRLAHTGRGGHSGRKTTIVTDAAPRSQIAALASLLQRTGNEVPRWLEWMAQEPPTVNAL